MPRQIDPNSLICMNDFVGGAPLKIDLVYANTKHPENIFKVPIYRSEAKFYLFEDLARVVLHGAELAYSRFGWVYVLKDGLRPIEAQIRMRNSPIVQANPHWLEDGPKRLLSPPGKGGHPRAMAVDITIEDLQGLTVDMGTAFDHLSSDPHANPAHRTYQGFVAKILKNRADFEATMVDAATALQVPLLPIPQEWWDYRLPPEIYDQYAPIHDRDLPEPMRMDVTV